MGKKTKSERRLIARQKRERTQVLVDSREQGHPFNVFHPDQISIIMQYKLDFETFDFQYLKLCRSVYSYYVGARGTIQVLMTPENEAAATQFVDIIHPLHTCLELADTTFTSIVNTDTFADNHIRCEKRLRGLVAFFKRTVPWFEDLWSNIMKLNPYEGIEVWKTRPFNSQSPVPEIPEVFTYMCFRAEREETKMGLDPIFFTEQLVLGMRDFFGVKTDRVGNVMCDDRNPEAWEEFSCKKN